MATYPFAALPRKLQAASRALEPSEPRIVAAGGKKLEQTITAAYRARTHDGRLSGTKTKRRQTPAPVFAKMKGVQKGADGHYVALIVPQGAYGLLEQRIDPHFIGPKKATSRGAKGALTRGRRKGGTVGAQASLDKYLAGRSQALKLPNGRFAANVMHPGTTPRRVFHPTAQKAGPAVTQAMAKEAGRVLRDGYRVAR